MFIEIGTFAQVDAGKHIYRESDIENTNYFYPNISEKVMR